MICRKGDKIFRQSDLIIVEGQSEPYGLSPVVLLCRRPPRMSSFPGNKTVVIIITVNFNNQHSILYNAH